MANHCKLICNIHFGYQNLVDLSKISNFPFLAANLFDDEGKHIFNPYSIITIKNVNIGIIGIVDDQISDFELKKNIKGLKFESAVKSLHEWVPIVRNKGADIIIVLTSIGMPFDREEVYQQILEENKDFNAPNECSFNLSGKPL